MLELLRDLVAHKGYADAAMPSASDLPFVFEQERDWIAAATDARVTRTIETPLIAGGRCTVVQGLTQLCLHSHGHRAQCAKLLRPRRHSAGERFHRVGGRASVADVAWTLTASRYWLHSTSIA